MKRLSIINIIVHDREKSAYVNDLLHDFGDCIIGRIGIPYSERGISVICIIVDAPEEITNSLSGKLGMINGVSAKTVTPKI